MSQNPYFGEMTDETLNSLVGEGTSSTPAPEAAAPPTAPVPPNAESSSPATSPSKISLGDLGEFTPEELQERLKEHGSLREQAQKWTNLESERQRVAQEALKNREAIEIQKLFQRPEVQQALEPILKQMEGQTRDPNTGQFQKRDSMFRDPRVSDDLIRQLQDDHTLVEHIREQAWAETIDKVWDGIKSDPNHAGVVDETFQKELQAELNDLSVREDRAIMPKDVLALASIKILQSPKYRQSLIEQGKKAILDELKNKPKGTQVLTGEDRAETPAPMDTSKMSSDQFWRHFKDQMEAATPS